MAFHGLRLCRLQTISHIQSCIFLGGQTERLIRASADIGVGLWILSSLLLLLIVSFDRKSNDIRHAFFLFVRIWWNILNTHLWETEYLELCLSVQSGYLKEILFDSQNLDFASLDQVFKRPLPSGLVVLIEFIFSITPICLFFLFFLYPFEFSCSLKCGLSC